MAAALLALFCMQPLSAETVIALLGDGPAARELLPVPVLEQELDTLLGDEFTVRLPLDKRFDGAWKLTGIRAAIERALRDPGVDLLICLGIVSCNELAHWPDLSKPVIAPIVADARLQDFPRAGGGSGKRNFTYVANFRSLDADVAAFRRAVPFRRLAFFAERVTAESIRSLREDKLAELERAHGIGIVPVIASGSAADFLAALPDQVDAVFVAPLLRLDDAALAALAQGLIERRLPSFSLLGQPEVERGLLLGQSGRAADTIRLARRIALDVQRILLGEAPAEIPVDLQASRRLIINMRTARALGFSPRYAILADAEQLYAEDPADAHRLSLLEAMELALEKNLNLAAAEYAPALAAEDLRRARAALLPQLQLSARGSRIDADHANPFFQAEKSIDGELSGRQLIYSDDAWAAYGVAKYLEQASDEELQLAVLDTLAAAGRAYLGLLRALALEQVQRSNLEVTRTNLGLARVRESIGISGRSDVLRWESQLARDRRNLIAAEAARHQASIRLNAVLDLPQQGRVLPPPQGIEPNLAIFTSERFQALIDNAATWTTFLDFVVADALERSPLLRRLALLEAAGERELTAARRRYWLPELSLEAFGGRNLERGGAGTNFEDFGIGDDSWGVTIGATLPVFSGGALKSNLNRSRLSLRQLDRQRAAARQRVEAEVRDAMEAAASSWSAIELTADAARAARENLRLITDAYSKGAVSVTDLIDAQNAALAAELSAAEARYLYLEDVIGVMRAAGDFSLLLDPGYVEQWFANVTAWFRERGVPLKLPRADEERR